MVGRRGLPLLCVLCLLSLWVHQVFPTEEIDSTVVERKSNRGDKVAIGILIAQNNINTIGRAALQTWVSEARAHGILVLFFGAFEDPVSAGIMLFKS